MSSVPSNVKGKRVLVIGRLPAVNRGVVEPLQAVGIAAEGSTEPEQASDRYDARDFDLIAFGRGVLGPLSDDLKRHFSARNPKIALVDVIQPAAIDQILAALAHDPRRPRFFDGFRVVTEDGEMRILATILAPCRVRLTLYRVTGGEMTAEILADGPFEPGAFETKIDADRLADANSLLLSANDEEYRLHPFPRDG